MPFSPVEEIIEEIRAGRMVIVCDDEDRENEGDLTVAAELVTPEHINFMAKYGRGLICLPMAQELIERLEIPEMVRHNSSRMGTAFTVSIEAREGISTGISAADRAHTCRVAVSDEAGPEDIVMPGHVFPLKARKGGVLQRPGQTEAAVDLARLAGLKPAGVICEVMKDDGTMARVPDLERFSAEHGIKMVTVAQIIEYRLASDPHVRCLGEEALPTRFGEFRLRSYAGVSTGLIHRALLAGEPGENGPPLVGVRAACPTGDALHSLRCDCGERLRDAMERVAAEGEGVILYLHPGPGAPLHPLPGGEDEDLAPYRAGVEILRDLGLGRVRLLMAGGEEPLDLESGPGPALAGRLLRAKAGVAAPSL
ncbi:GTP cyclohydrolase II / 3,4-dihydroxy-2-butanone 4-phosphate synthase [Rubrobacter xylanophilus DSM 9941]|uniref:3,4-dihydroxy-2-butanone 4-phosphate synthase n=1 Tax=Rubrobacter xylanophilus (strain DSM 9941 / JCM 11954 / NBRC 16129 / PRD-1) TaxID=266117 RepID=Q1AZ21_RUBXD|nr:3,4-dihydroxy-2-butanone-4-phosphate synthase [Rubrobacter xylanophilus]ABG03357.1 GTP cyclohydrolase II / 3,4-dihydroxy-2-butanone 4-phosphate synthase [Rubrobacter xylanophilus DSM 9941]